MRWESEVFTRLMCLQYEHPERERERERFVESTNPMHSILTHNYRSIWLTVDRRLYTETVLIQS